MRYSLKQKYRETHAYTYELYAISLNSKYSTPFDFRFQFVYTTKRYWPLKMERDELATVDSTSLLAPVLLYQSKHDLEPYNKIVVPSSMRSLYWKFFGFPANKQNEITNKHRIVCAICGTSIAYNKNTTNLQTHLNTRHPEIAREYFPGAKNTKPLTQSTIKRIKVETIDNDSWNEYTKSKVKTIRPQVHPTGIVKKATVHRVKMNQKLLYDDQDANNSLIDEIIIPPIEYAELNCDDIETVAENLEYAEADEPSNIYATKDHSFSIRLMNIERVNQSCDSPNATRDAVIENRALSPKYDSFDINEAACRMIVTDLLSLAIVEGKGFQRFIQQISADAATPNSAAVSFDGERSFQYSATLTCFLSHIGRFGRIYQPHTLMPSPKPSLNSNQH